MWYTIKMAAKILCLRMEVPKFFKHILIFLVLVWLAVVFGVGGWIDSICIEGRLSQAQAEAANSHKWEKCPGYRHGECQTEVNDRVFVRECSEFFKVVFP